MLTGECPEFRAAKITLFHSIQFQVARGECLPKPGIFGLDLHSLVQIKDSERQLVYQFEQLAHGVPRSHIITCTVAFSGLLICCESSRWVPKFYELMSKQQPGVNILRIHSRGPLKEQGGFFVIPFQRVVISNNYTCLGTVGVNFQPLT